VSPARARAASRRGARARSRKGGARDARARKPGARRARPRKANARKAAARRAGAQARRPAARAGDLCVREVATVGPQGLARDAALRMAEEALGTLVVVDEVRRPLGILTDRDLVVRCIAEGTDARRARVERLMSGPVAWVHEEAPLSKALEEMARLRVRRLVVVDERERLAGVLALDDLLCDALGSGSPLGRVLRRTMR